MRVFINSTMRDLANERDLVCRKLIDFNFEPVNAEGLLPTGFSSWDKLSREIRSCDLFILILGEKYGWIPDKGPRSEEGLSVTHLEYKEAQLLGIPILPFVMELPYLTDSQSGDAKRRDDFRKEVMNWDNGHFVSTFKLATDLAEKTGRAVIDLLSDEFQDSAIRKRASFVSGNANGLKRDVLSITDPSDSIPADLILRIKKREAVLFAGAGVSLSAGLPSAAAFSEKLAQVIREGNPDYSINGVGSVFAGIATDLEAIKGREALIDAISALMHPPQGAEPSSAHNDAVRLFDHIVTTNYDSMFEQAAQMNGIPSHLIYNEVEDCSFPEHKMIIKLHGSYESPGSLLLTEQDVLMLDKSRKNLWDATIKLFQNKTIVVVGSSLRDPSIFRLFIEAGTTSGYFVTPEIHGYTQELMKRWNLQCIKADANHFFRTIAQILSE